MYRTGKSYLLNRMLLNRDKGFAVGPSIKPCTKGLWIWPNLLEGKTEEGKAIPIILIDTEGFGAYDEDLNHDTKIFTFAILLSSYFIYNSKGTIDEKAIQSLSFVVELSKHIQLKSSNSRFENKGSSNPEELSTIFPKFLWVLRDFVLKLVDTDGNPITSHEYLESVLNATFFNKSKNINENDPINTMIDSKNNIRQMIKMYFKDRTCHTMVRPVTEEKLLQNLPNLTDDELRPEFLVQVKQLQDQVLNNMKVKKFQGQEINGEIYITMIKSFITAVNAGAVPNIENTWSNICKVESYKALEESEKMYDKLLKQKLSETKNLTGYKLRELHAEVEKQCIRNFCDKSFGEAPEDSILKLKNKIKEKYVFFERIADEEIKNNLIKQLNKYYEFFEQKLQKNEINIDSGYTDIRMEFNRMDHELESNFGDYKLKNEYFNEFKAKVLFFLSETIVSKAKNELMVVKNENSQLLSKFNREIDDLKQTSERELLKKNSQVEGLKVEINEAKEQVNNYKQKLNKELENKLKDNKEAEEKVVKANRKIEELERKINENEKKNIINDDKFLNLEKANKALKLEFEKEKAKLLDDIEGYKKNIEDLKLKEKESIMELKSQIKETSSSQKESEKIYEDKIKSLNKNVENLQEKIFELENLKNKQELSIINEKKRFDELSSKYTSDLSEKENKIRELNMLLLEEKEKGSEVIKEIDEEYKHKNTILEIEKKDLEKKLKLLDESIKSITKNFEKEKVLLRDSNSELEQKHIEALNSIEELKAKNEENLRNLENKTFSLLGKEEKESQKKIEELKEYFEKEKDEQKAHFEKQLWEKNEQLASLNEKFTELKNSNTNKLFEFEHLMSDKNEEYENMEKAINILTKEKKLLNDKYADLKDEHKQKIKELQMNFDCKLEDKDIKHLEEISELNRNAEKQINQVKKLYETEKLRYEEKIKNDKESNEKKVNELVSEYEEKFERERTERENEAEQFKKDFEELEKAFQENKNSSTNEINNLKVKLDVLQEDFNNQKTNYENNEAKLENIIKELNVQFEEERNEFLNKNDQLISQINNKDKEIYVNKVKIEELESNLLEKEKQFNTKLRESEVEKQEYAKTIDSLKEKYIILYKSIKNNRNEIINEELMKYKFQYTREDALLKQEVEYLNKKIEEMEKNYEFSQKRYEECLCKYFS